MTVCQCVNNNNNNNNNQEIVECDDQLVQLFVLIHDGDRVVMSIHYTMYELYYTV